MSELHGEVVAFVCHSGEPGVAAVLVYARNASQAARLAAITDADGGAWRVFRHPPGDGLRGEAGRVDDEAARQQAGLIGSDANGERDCPACGIGLIDDAAEPAPCLCPRCGYRICEGQV